MDNLTLVKHAAGAPGLRFFGMGANFWPQKGNSQLQRLFNRNSLWAKGRNSKDIKTMLSNSAVVITIWRFKQLIGFGRATSDQIYRAILWDIVVDRNFQNLGLGKTITTSLLKDPMVAKAERIYLMTTNHENFYTKIGFRKEINQNLMILNNKK